MTLLAAASKPFIDWAALGKIAAVALIGCVGVVLVFGILLLAVKHASGTENSGQRAVFYGVGAICGAICIGACAIGIYAMAHKPSSAPAPPAKSKSAALPTPRASSTKLIASAP
jgi:hypothetical protein